MKTLAQLFKLVGEAVEQNHAHTGTWFVDFSGHVNKISIRYYFTGWGLDVPHEELNQELNEEGIQSAYWFIKTRLNK